MGWLALALPIAKWGAVTTAKAAGSYVITQGVNNAGDRASGRGLAEVDDMWCYDSRVENGETMCPTFMVPTLDMSSGNLVCCPPHVADKYTIQLLNSLEDELDDEEEAVGVLGTLSAQNGREMVRYGAYLHGKYGRYFTEESKVGLWWCPDGCLMRMADVHMQRTHL